MKWNAIFLLCASALAWAGVRGGVIGGMAQKQPQPLIHDLRAVRKGDKVTLTWSQPPASNDAVSPSGVTRICRAISSTPAISSLHPACTVIGKVNAGASKDKAGSSAGLRHFTDTLDDKLQEAGPPQFALYRVERAGADGRTVADSNLASVSLAPVAKVKGLHLQTDVHGVYLIWEQESLKKLAAVVYGYRVLRQEKNGRPEKDPPAAPGSVGRVVVSSLHSVIHTREGERWAAVDPNIEWEKTYVYHVQPVTRVYSPNHKLIAEVVGEDSEPAEIFLHDVFPPATPEELNAMAGEIPGQKFVDLLWRPNSERDLAGYNIYRREQGGTLARIATAPADMLSYQDTNVAAGHKYFYALSAIDRRGNESGKTPETNGVTP